MCTILITAIGGFLGR